MLIRKRLKALCCLMVLSLLFVACSSNKSSKELTQFKETQLILGTLGQITVYSDSEKKANEALSKAFSHIDEIENVMSTSKDSSDIFNLNKEAGLQSVEIDPSTMNLLIKGVEYYHTTKGSFNIAIGSLINLWGIGEEWQKLPSKDEISEAKTHIDLDQLEISKEKGTAFIKDPDMLLDLGGIAKGYAVDKGVDVLKENGIENGLVDLGGDVFALGNKPDGNPWRIGINNPEIGVNNSIARISVANKSIVTSGDYERYFIENDKRYHHIIDPSTGFPSESELVSVTVVSDTSTDGDVISTAAFVLGLGEGLELIESLPGVDGILITKNKEVYVSSGLKDNLEILDDDFKVVNN